MFISANSHGRNFCFVDILAKYLLPDYPDLTITYLEITLFFPVNTRKKECSYHFIEVLL